MKKSQFSKKLLTFSLFLLFESGIVAAAQGEVPVNASFSKRNLALRDVVSTTLAQQPAIIISREQLVQSGGGIKLTHAEFDWTLESNLNHTADYLPTGASTLYDRIITTLFDTRLVKKTDYGISLEPGITLKRSISDAAPGNGISSDTGTSLRLSFTLAVPLLQGRGKTVGTAREAAARFDYEAARHDLLHSISLAAYDSIVAYWQYVAAIERRQLAVAAEERAGSITANTESLVHADEAPQAELVSAEANRLEKKISLEHAELGIHEARQKMGLLMGLSPEAAEGLPLPADRLPIISQNADKYRLDNRLLIFARADQRNDLLSLLQRSKSADSLVMAAQDALDPKLDLISGIGYDGYQTGSSMQRAAQTFENRQKYPDWSVGLRFSYPLENNLAKGNFVIAASQLAQSRIRVRELQRAIEISLRTILQSMQNVARETATADLAVASYKRAVENEKEKYLMGESTLFDLLFTQDKLESAYLTQTDARLRGAILLTRLQFESGSILSCSGDVCDFNPETAALLGVERQEAN